MSTIIKWRPNSRRRQWIVAKVLADMDDIEKLALFGMWSPHSRDGREILW